MKYCFDQKKFKKRLIELGYKGLNGFAVKNKIHRNTLYSLMKGQEIFNSSYLKIANVLKVDPTELMIAKVQSSHPIKDVDEIWPIVTQLVKRDKGLGVFLLGSRVHDKARTYSDWDLGLFRYPDPLTGREYLRFKDLVEEMSEDLVRFVDVVNLNQAPLWFLEGLDRILFLDGNSQTNIYLRGLLYGIKKQKVA